MKVDLKFVQEQRDLFRHHGAAALNPAVIEALFVVAELSLGGPQDEEPAPAAEATPIRKRTKSA